MGIFKPGYVMHQYQEWLLTTVANVLDDELAISNAGLLRNGTHRLGRSVRPRNPHHPRRLRLPAKPPGHHQPRRQHRDHIPANHHRHRLRQHRAIVLSEKGQTYKVKHSRNSGMKLVQARDTLTLVQTLADDFTHEIQELCRTTVTTP